MKYKKKSDPVFHCDVLELPALAGVPEVRTDISTARAEEDGKRGKAILLVATKLALLSAFIPMPAQDAHAQAVPTLYISGGGAGGSTGPLDGGQPAAAGGPHAAPGWESTNPDYRNGGGAYVGDGTDGYPDNARNQLGKVGNSPSGGAPIAGPGQSGEDGLRGGEASFTVTTGTFEGWSIQVQAGNGHEDNSYNTAHGGDASLHAASSTVITNVLQVTSGVGPASDADGGTARAEIGTLRSTGAEASYTFRKGTGPASGDVVVEIGTLDARSGDVTLATPNIIDSGNVQIGRLVLGGGRTFTLGASTTLGETFSVTNRFEVWGQTIPGGIPQSSTFNGVLNANGKDIHFYLPNDIRGNEVPALLAVDGAVNLAGSTVGVGVLGATEPANLQLGESITLLSATGALTGPANVRSTGTGMSLILHHEFSLNWNTNNLWAILESIGAADHNKAYSTGFVSGAAFLNQGSDLVAGKGIHEAMLACDAKQDEPYCTGVFGAVSGGKSRYKTGSHADVSGVSLMAGAALGKNLTADNRLTIGGFVEYGSASYDTYNSFSSGSFNGNGDLEYFGVGALGRMDFANALNSRNVYAEGSARMGGVRNKYNNMEISPDARYKASSMYFSAHLGAGMVVNISQKNSIDLYGKYFWTNQGSDTVQMNFDTVRFSSVNSHRARFGGRLFHELEQNVNLYAGAAYEYEFDGRAKAAGTFGEITTNFDVPDLKGSTGIAEFGVVFKPSKSRPLFVDFGLQGFVGKRQGGIGSLRARYEF